MSFGAIGGGGGSGGGGGNGLVADAINDGTTTVAPSQNAVYDALALKANLVSPALTGTPTAPTAAAGTNTTQIATTAWVKAEPSVIHGDSSILNVVAMTQAAYDLITPVSTTLYVVTP